MAAAAQMPSIAPKPRIVIVGAGPCGLAAGRELARLGHDDWTIFERDGHAGGHASSVLDDHGFTWDQGGHVVFSHFGEFDALLADVMGDDVEEHARSSFIRIDERWVPYPFQNNLRYLAPEVACECLQDLVDAEGGNPDMDFAAWAEAMFGRAITREFMRPYNLKVWATPLEQMSATWIADRVSVVDWRRALQNLVLQRDDTTWGPNSTFGFPRAGGTGEIYRRVAEQLGDRARFGLDLVRIDSRRREIAFADGTSTAYDALVSTMPLDRLVAAIVDCPSFVREAARLLEHTSVAVVGVGYELPLADDRSWLYFPEPELPFYRVTNFAKYAAANVPGADIARYRSYLTETSYSRYRPRPSDDLGGWVADSLAAVGLVDVGVDPVSIHVIDVEYAYPVPTLRRDAALKVIHPWLEERGIHARGRFGTWRYELGNMDHAVKMGIDVARFLCDGEPEELFPRHAL